MLSLGGVVFSGLWIALRGWGPYGGVVLVERGPSGVLPLGDVVLVGVVLRGCCP